MASPTFPEEMTDLVFTAEAESRFTEMTGLGHPDVLPEGLRGAPGPRLLASLGPLRILWNSIQQTYTVGRAPDCDWVLPESSNLASWKHCELGWDGRKVTIKDLASTNGTWVNCKRLYDGKIRVLRQDDLIHLSPEPLLTRAHENTNELPRYASGSSPLEFQFHYHSRDDLVRHRGLAGVGRVVRDCLDEIENVLSRLRGLRVDCHRHSMPTSEGVPVRAVTKSYRAGRDRRDLDNSDRPGTPAFIPPPALPVNEDFIARAISPKPYQARSTPLVGARDFTRAVDELLYVGMAHDPHGPPRDHPDLIYREYITVNTETEPQDGYVPDEIVRWSKRYCLPIGLHRGWADFSSIPYGPRLPPSAAQPHHSPAFGFFVPVALGFTAKKTSSSSAKRKRSGEDGGEPTAVKRRQTRTRSGIAMSKREHRPVSKLKATAASNSRKPTQLRRGVLSHPGQEHGPPPKPDQDVDTTTVSSHRQPLKRKRDSSESGDQPSKRLAPATGSLHRDSTLRTRSDDAPDNASISDLHTRRRAAPKLTEPARRSMRVRDRAATVLKYD